MFMKYTEVTKLWARDNAWPTRAEMVHFSIFILFYFFCLPCLFIVSMFSWLVYSVHDRNTFRLVFQVVKKEATRLNSSHMWSLYSLFFSRCSCTFLFFSYRTFIFSKCTKWCHCYFGVAFPWKEKKVTASVNMTFCSRLKVGRVLHGPYWGGRKKM